MSHNGPAPALRNADLEVTRLFRRIPGQQGQQGAAVSKMAIERDLRQSGEPLRSIRPTRPIIPVRRTICRQTSDITNSATTAESNRRSRSRRVRGPWRQRGCARGWTDGPGAAPRSAGARRRIPRHRSAQPWRSAFRREHSSGRSRQCGRFTLGSSRRKDSEGSRVGRPVIPRFSIPTSASTPEPAVTGRMQRHRHSGSCSLPALITDVSSGR